MLINLKLELDDEKIIDKEMLEQMKASARKVARSAITAEIEDEIRRSVKRRAAETVDSKVKEMLDRGYFNRKLEEIIKEQMESDTNRELIIARIDKVLNNSSLVRALIENLVKDRAAKMIYEAFNNAES